MFFVLFRVFSDAFWMHCSSLGYITQTLNLWNLFLVLQHAILDYDWFSAHLFVSLGERSRGCPITDMQLQPSPYHAHLNGLLLNLPYITVFKTNLTYENHLLLFRSKGVRVITPPVNCTPLGCHTITYSFYLNWNKNGFWYDLSKTVPVKRFYCQQKQKLEANLGH